MTDDGREHDLVIERTVAAPPELVWSMWTDPDHFAQWYGPNGATIAVATMDVRVGGQRLIRMDVTTPDGPMTMWFAGAYVDVVEHQRLVYTDAMSDEHGNPLSAEQAGMPPDHPRVTEVRIELAPVDDGTRMTLTHVGIPAGSPGAVGWTMALDKLTAHLSGARG